MEDNGISGDPLHTSVQHSGASAVDASSLPIGGAADAIDRKLSNVGAWIG